MLLGACFVITRPGSGNSTTFVPFNSILRFPAPARRTQPPVSRMSLTMRCLHKTLTFIHVLPLLLLHSGSQRAGVDSSSLGVKVGLLSGSQQFVTTPHRENKQPSALTLTTMDNIELPVSAVPVLTDHNLERAHRGTRPCKSLRNQTRNLLALRCQCQQVRRTPGMLDSLAVQTTSSAKDIIMDRVQTKQPTVKGLFISFTQRVQTICYPSVDSRTTAAFSHFYQRDLVRCPPEKKKIIFKKKKKNPIC